jgi:hypothetical protein
MADQKVEYIIELLKKGSGATDAANDLSKVEKKGKDAATSLATLGREAKAAFAAFGGYALIQSSLNAFIESERAIAKLNQALVSTGRFSKDLSEDLQALAKDFQDVTQYTDEEVTTLMAKLIAAGAPLESIKRITKAVLDLSTLMGKDLPRATLQMVQALQGEGIAFQGISLKFKEGSTEAEKFNQALKEIEKTAGGQSEKAMDGAIGRVERIKKAWEDAKEEMGKWVAFVVDKIGEIIDKLQEYSNKVGANVDIDAKQHDHRRKQLEQQIDQQRELNKLTEEEADLLKAQLRQGFTGKTTKVFGPAPGTAAYRFTDRTERDFQAESAALGSVEQYLKPRPAASSRAEKPKDVSTPGLRESDRIATEQAILDMLEDEWAAADEFQKKRIKDEDEVTKHAMEAHQQKKQIVEAERTLQDEIVEAQLSGIEREIYAEQANHEKRIEMIQELKFEDEDRYMKLIELENQRHTQEMEHLEKKKEAETTFSGMVAEGMGQVRDYAEKRAASGMAEAFTQVIEGSKNAKEAFRDFAASFMREIGKMIMQTLIYAAIKKAVFMMSTAAGAADGGQFVAARGGMFPRMAAGGMLLAAGGVDGVREVNGPTVFPKFNVVAGEAGREVMTVLANPRLMNIGGAWAQIGNVGTRKLAITDAAALQKMASGGLTGSATAISSGPDGEGRMVLRVILDKGLLLQSEENSVRRAKLEVTQDMSRPTALSKATKRLVS